MLHSNAFVMKIMRKTRESTLKVACRTIGCRRPGCYAVVMACRGIIEHAWLDREVLRGIEWTSTEWRDAGLDQPKGVESRERESGNLPVTARKIAAPHYVKIMLVD